MPSASPPAPSTTTTTSSKPFSISLKSKQPKPVALPPSSTPNPKKRPHSSLAHESDSEPDAASQPEPQLLASFDHAAGGAILANGASAHGTKKAPLVIPAQKNRDWREESRKKRAGRNLLPKEVQEMRAGKAVEGSTNGDGEAIQYGLNFVQRNAEVKADGALHGDVAMQDARAATEGAAQRATPPLTADEEALEALKGTARQRATLVIGGSSADPSDTLPNETESLFTRAPNSALSEAQLFKSDVASRPDSASLADYSSIPVEEFGAALLRGMGWKDEIDADGKVMKGASGKTDGTKGRPVERRPALLGIGAKEVPKELREELGAWGKGAQGGGGGKGGKGRKAEVGYNPVVLRDKATGEMVTEEEMKQRVVESREKAEDERYRAREKESSRRRTRDDGSRRDEDESEDDERRDGERRGKGERDRDGKPKSSRYSRYDDGDDDDSDRRDRRRRRDDDGDGARDSGRDRQRRDRDRGRRDDHREENERRRRREREGEGKEGRRGHEERDRRRRHRERDGDVARLEKR